MEDKDGWRKIMMDGRRLGWRAEDQGEWWKIRVDCGR